MSPRAHFHALVTALLATACASVATAGTLQVTVTGLSLIHI